MNEKLIREKYNEITTLLIEKKLTITTMESCTSGQIASLLTDTEGASSILKGAFVTYSNEAKKMYGVPSSIIEKYGVYSKKTAEAMAIACKEIYKSDIGIGITGTFGNIDQNNPDSKAQRIYFSIAINKSDYNLAYNFEIKLKTYDSRYEYKMAAAEKIAEKLFKILMM